MPRSPDRSAPLPDPRSDAATLRAFVAVARLGTVSRGARALGRAQPSVSARIAALEEVWGTRLFRREARGMRLTPEGARLLPRAEQVLVSLEELDAAAGLPVTAPGLLRVGCGDALGRDRLPRALRELFRERPGLHVRVLEGSRERLLAALRSGEIDVALVVIRGPAPPEPGLEISPVLDTPVDVLLPPATRPQGRKTVSIRRLAGLPLVTLQPDSGFRRHVESAFASAGLPFHPAVEVGNFSLVRRFVAAGLGAAPVPAVAFEARTPGPALRRRRLRDIAPVRYGRVVRTGVPLPDPARHLLRLLQGGADRVDVRPPGN